MKYIQHIKTTRSITIVAREGTKDRVVTFDESSDKFAEAVKILKSGKKENLVTLLEDKKQAGVKVLKKATPEGAETHTAWFNKEKLPTELAKTVQRFLDTDTDVTPLKNFWERCKKNPVENSRKELFRHVSMYGVTLLPDGRMLLYKGVRDNLCSHHDGITKHVFGKFTEVDRSKCACHPEHACGYGLHTAPFTYVSKYYSNGKVIEVIVDPEDVTSVPASEAKMLCWRYLPNCEVNRNGIGVKTGLIASVKPVKAKPARDPEVDRAEAKKLGKVLKPVKAEKLSRFTFIPYLDSITIVGKVMVAAGFSPKQKVKVWLGKNRVVITPSVIDGGVKSGNKGGDFTLSDEALAKRYRLDIETLVEATTKDSGSLRIRATTIGRHLGVPTDGEFKVAVLEVNAVAIYAA
jgi:hypothetical protein